MFITKRHILLLACTIIALVQIHASDQKMSVRFSGTSMMDTEPKQVISTLFQVTNLFDEEKEFVAEVNLPVDWKLITQEDPFRIQSGETDYRLISIFVPPHAPCGIHHITYRVFSRQDPTFSDYQEISVNVLAVKDLQLSIIEEPKYVIGGESYEVVILLTNKSNIADSICIKGHSKPFKDITLSANAFRLKSGKSKKIIAKVFTDTKIGYKTKNQIIISANFSNDEKNITKAYSRIDVIPTGSMKADKYHRIPLNVALKHVAQEYDGDSNGTQVDISARGSLDEDNTKNIEFRLKAPDIYETSVLAEHDQYYFTYRDSVWNIGLGDIYYSITPLLEFSQYGRGLKLQYNRTNLGAGGYFQNSRFIIQREKQIASYAYYNVLKNYRIYLNYLNKTVKKDSLEETNDIYSIALHAIPQKDIKVEMEYGASGKADRTHSAYHLFVEGAHNQEINYRFKYIFAGADFNGYYRDRNLISGYVSYYLLQNLRLVATLKQTENRYLINDGYVSFYNFYDHFGLRYKIKKGPTLLLAYGERKQKDLQTVSRFNYRDRMAVLELYQVFRNFSMSAKFESGNTHDFLSENNERMNRFIFSAYAKPFRNHIYQAFIYYDKGGYYNTYQERHISFGINANIQLFNSTSVYFNVQNHFSPESFYLDRNVLDCRLKHTFGNKHSLTLRVRNTIQKNTLNKIERAFLFQYDLPFGIPVSHKKEVGFVRGSVLDVETMQPIQGLIVRVNGSSAVTDKEGRFVFPGITPDTYYLRIDNSKIGLDRITTQKTPMLLKVVSGQEMTVNLGITRSAKVRGKVLVYKVVNDSSDHFSAEKLKENLNDFHVSGNNNGENLYVTNGKTKLVPDYYLSNILVELKRDDETKKFLTDDNGVFNIEDLRPGRWTLHIYDANLPDYHRLDQDTYYLDLEPGVTKEILVKVLPKRRRIQFIQDGGTIIEEKPQ